MLKQKPIRSEKHRRFIASLPCCVSGVSGQTQAAHIRSGFFGMGAKPGDDLCVPLSWKEHDRQHKCGERKFWEPYGGIQEAKELAQHLYRFTGNEDMARQLIARFLR